MAIREVMGYTKDFLTGEYSEHKKIKEIKPVRGITTIQLFDAESGDIIKEIKTENVISEAVIKAAYHDSIFLRMYLPPHQISTNTLMSGLYYNHKTKKLNHGIYSHLNADHSLTASLIITDYEGNENAKDPIIRGNIIGFSDLYKPHSSASSLKGTINNAETTRVNGIVHYVVDFPTHAGNGTFRSIYLAPHESNISLDRFDTTTTAEYTPIYQGCMLNDRETRGTIGQYGNENLTPNYISYLRSYDGETEIMYGRGAGSTREERSRLFRKDIKTGVREEITMSFANFSGYESLRRSVGVKNYYLFSIGYSGSNNILYRYNLSSKTVTDHQITSIIGGIAAGDSSLFECYPNPYREDSIIIIGVCSEGNKLFNYIAEMDVTTMSVTKTRRFWSNFNSVPYISFIPNGILCNATDKDNIDLVDNSISTSVTLFNQSDYSTKALLDSKLFTNILSSGRMLVYYDDLKGYVSSSNGNVYNPIPWGAHNLLPEAVTKTPTNTMKIQYDIILEEIDPFDFS